MNQIEKLVNICNAKVKEGIDKLNDYPIESSKFKNTLESILRCMTIVKSSRINFTKQNNESEETK